MSVSSTFNAKVIYSNLPSQPGVYRMLNKNGKVLYVGKARNLKRRVASYTNLSNLTLRLQKMVVQTTKLEVITTHTELMKMV